MKCIDPLVTGYERGTFEERSAQTESSPRQSRKNSEDLVIVCGNYSAPRGLFCECKGAWCPACYSVVADDDVFPIKRAMDPDGMVKASLTRRTLAVS